ncbi:unnamed protein product [Brugia timori]|uniref:Uncharacterized protein n=1 Tax=Brugia timori TaxID=42155 RepID=A0A3P7ZAB6_9BILA|nr:unnamed protein product [Brugia timori]
MGRNHLIQHYIQRNGNKNLHHGQHGVMQIWHYSRSTRFCLKK